VEVAEVEQAQIVQETTTKFLVVRVAEEAELAFVS
jgi:hypothetical protein